MLASELPFEIISHIASFLSFKRKYICTVVCKSWQAPLQESLWSELRIFNRKKMEKICDQSTDEYQSYHRNGQHVKTLFLEGELRASDGELHTFQQHFQSLNSLTIEQNGLSNDNFAATANWNLWGKLTELTIHLSKWNSDSSEKPFLDIFACLPCLTKLRLSQGWVNGSMYFTWNDFETIHDYLPRLESLSVNMTLASLSSNDLDLIQDVKPANRLVIFGPEAVYHDYRWLCYFALKYPNIHTLGKMSFGNDRLVEDCPSSMIPWFESISFVFQYLKAITSVIGGHEGKPNLLFWNVLCPFHIPIKRLEYDVHVSLITPGTFESIVKEAVNPFSKSVESVCIRTYNYIRGLWVLTATLDYCPNLVDLNLRIRCVIIEMDILLNRCVALKRLKLSGGSLIISPEAPKTTTLHGLRMMELTFIKTSSKTLNNISFRCRRLNYMQLTNTSITGSISSTTGNLCVDMSYTRFKVLLLRNVRFNISEIHSDINNINFMVLSRPIIDQQLRDDTRHRRRRRVSSWYRLPFFAAQSDALLSSKGHPKNGVEATWFYTPHKYEGVEGWMSQTWVLTETEVKKALDYYNHFNHGESTALKKQYKPADNIRKKRSDWKGDLFRGYATLKCGYVAEYTIGSGWFTDDYVWQRLFVSLN
ncbi:hypothetical protein J3Q64DRAFT_1699593 [Phycomyces blakesleeanus]|uniref:F-box domain-containing protein n=2 Tax=Phycomyces blakesleeanus TaxID=4837 RepID=A0A163DM49_PHYB8|nr:hypothetical protein PHYBLDRAFT_65686 [Phycomyces blakesleeanus NRRL 1555(-)]OAD72270.1 hypothetical protein PHYBLDRAFT_65686 [Phycomyces blakesleeanus NRRL 1555(-)]|eukprot:XP_018290310.1 hypothetical protein PHYBLDRAFT_65686 [Phycomyces blakesleeanus NRRL 1555(-)]